MYTFMLPFLFTIEVINVFFGIWYFTHNEDLAVFPVLKQYTNVVAV